MQRPEHRASRKASRRVVCRPELCARRRSDLINPKVAASRTHPLHFRRHGVIFAKSRELQIATLSLLLLFLIAPALQAQTPQPQPPAVRETARAGIAQGFLGC